MIKEPIFLARCFAESMLFGQFYKSYYHASYPQSSGLIKYNKGIIQTIAKFYRGPLNTLANTIAIGPSKSQIHLFWNSLTLTVMTSNAFGSYFF